MNDESPRVLGLQASDREARLWRVFKSLLTIVACFAAIMAVRSDYERAAKGFGFDFYVFWLGGDAVRDHQVSGTSGVLELYTQAAHIKVGQRYFDLARTQSRRQQLAATARRSVDTVSSPFYYWIFSRLTPGNYDREYQRYIFLSVACMVGTIAILGWRLRFSIAGIGAATALAAISAPVYSEFTVINFNFPELAACCIYLLLRDSARRSTRLSFAWPTAAGIVMGLLGAAKPNLILFPLLLGVRGFALRRWREVLAEAGGFVLAVAGAIAVSSQAFGGAFCWVAWGRFILELSSRPTMPSVFGNFSVTRDIYEATGRNFITLFSVLGTLIAICAVWAGRCPVRRPSATSPQYLGERAGVRGHVGEIRPFKEKPLTLTPSPEYGGEGTSCDFEFRHDLAIFGIAAAVTLLTSGLAWLHYPILLFPFLLLAASPARLAALSQFVRYVLLSAVVLLLMVPPPEELQKLLSVGIEVNIRSWIHCTQGAVIVTLGMALWFESRLMGSTG